MLADPSSGLTQLEAFTIQGCGYQAFLWQATECTILVAGIYLKTNETLQSETTATIIGKLLALLEGTRHPYVIIGDWQNTPDTISSTVLPAKFILASYWLQITASCQETLLHNTLASTMSLTTEWVVPWRPHALLTMQFDIEAATREYRQIQFFPPLPKVPDIDFRPWTTYQAQAYTRLSSMATPSTNPRKHGRIGYARRNNIYSKSTHGQCKAGEQISRQSPSHLFLQRQDKPGRKASQPIGNSSK